jgi:peptide-methionine (S)-S-oxide reductase
MTGLSTNSAADESSSREPNPPPGLLKCRTALYGPAVPERRSEPALLPPLMAPVGAYQAVRGADFDSAIEAEVGKRLRPVRTIFSTRSVPAKRSHVFEPAAFVGDLVAARIARCCRPGRFDQCHFSSAHAVEFRNWKSAGGDVSNATYRNHGSHAEAIEIVFYPQRISYRDLLEFFFQIHDPTTRNRQGNDVGVSYRSAIFYTSEEQKRVAEDTIADVEASGLWPGKAVTEIAPSGDFWEAEPVHQGYLERYPTGYTCHFIRPGWKLPARAKELQSA